MLILSNNFAGFHDGKKICTNLIEAKVSFNKAHQFCSISITVTFLSIAKAWCQERFA